MKKYLSRIHINNFGAFSNVTLDGLSPHMNVIFGENEAGKTSIAAFVRGVLFGWEEARGTRNTYKPKGAQRSGSLIFADAGESAPNAGEEELSRERNADGLKGNTRLVADIDRDTFTTMFSLTSDELKGLRNTTDVTARLLTAGSGTTASPAEAFTVVSERLGAFTSRAAAEKDSLVNLAAEASACKTRMAQAEKDAELCKQQDKELYELVPERNKLNDHLAELNARTEMLAASRAHIEKLEQSRNQLQEEIDSLLEQQIQLKAAQHASGEEAFENLLGLSNAADRDLREAIDSFAQREAKCDHRCESAEETYKNSKAAYDVAKEAAGHYDDPERGAQARRQRIARMLFANILPLAFLCMGIVLALHGSAIQSLSFVALGFGLVVMALVMTVSLIIMLFRPNKKEEELKERLANAQWIMLQDMKKLEACKTEQQDLSTEIKQFLEQNGLKDAGASLKRARNMLDEATAERSELALNAQRMQAASARIAQLRDRHAATSEQLMNIYEQVGLGEGNATLPQLDTLIAQTSCKRDALIEAAEHLNARYGELKQSLAAAKGEHSFDALKLAYQQIRTRQNESMRAFARLLFARRMLEDAIAAWESKSQPEVYVCASELMALMTEGKWTKVSITPDGRLQVTDAAGQVREPVHLSLGTCQQLYLSLRIALLCAADNVGSAIPVLADDILVHFDTHRRRGAAAALMRLALKRQVILFTCHEEVVNVMRECNEETVVIDLEL